MSANLTIRLDPRVHSLIAFWSHALAAALFAALTLWRIGDAARQPLQRFLAGAFAVTACWAWLAAVGAGDPVVGYAESARNLLWISLLYSLSAAGEEREHGLKLVYGAVAAVIGLQLIGATLELVSPSGALAQTGLRASDHHRGRRARPGPQRLWPGGAGKPLAHPRSRRSASR